MKRVLLACGVAATVGLAGLAGAASVSAQTNCHPAYGGCLEIVYDLNCEHINWAVVQVWNVNDDPYGLDVLYGPGNGWTCDGIG